MKDNINQEHIQSVYYSVPLHTEIPGSFNYLLHFFASLNVKWRWKPDSWGRVTIKKRQTKCNKPNLKHKCTQLCSPQAPESLSKCNAILRKNIHVLWKKLLHTCATTLHNNQIFHFLSLAPTHQNLEFSISPLLSSPNIKFSTFFHYIKKS